MRAILVAIAVTFLLTIVSLAPSPPPGVYAPPPPPPPPAPELQSAAAQRSQAAATAPARVRGAAPQSRRNDRLFPPIDLGLLEAPDRDQWQKPEQIMDALAIADGAIVADLGAGGGWFTIRLARRVGPNGLVYAEDIQPQMIEAINRRVQRENLTNVRTVLGTERDPKLPRGIDAVLIVETYHEMDDPVALLRNVAGSLKPQGRIGIVDFTPGAGGPGPRPEERVDPETVIKAAAAADLQLIAREPVPPFQYLLVFGRQAAAFSGRATP